MYLGLRCKNYIALYLLAFSLFLLCGCSLHIKTPIVIDYARFGSIQPNSTKDDVEMYLGSPQGIGVHILSGEKYPLNFYYGLAGIATTKTIRCDSGTAFISYDNDQLEDIIYFTSSINDPAMAVNKDLGLSTLIDNITIGQTSIDVAYERLGKPDYKGKRIENRSGLIHDIIYYDASRVTKNGVMIEKWILIGYDDNQIIQDLIWVSSSPEETEGLGVIKSQQFKQLSGLSILPDPKSLRTDTVIDPAQVDALLKSDPVNISEINEVLGHPTAIGFKRFKNNAPMLLSNWSYSKVDIKGTEKNYIPTRKSNDNDFETKRNPSYIVMEITQSRLMVGHSEDGVINEVIWFKPFKAYF